MQGREMSGAEIAVQALIDLGVDTIFGYPGGAVLPIYDEMFRRNAIKHVLVRHEQAAAHAAEGYARTTGKPGVVMVTSGPGATNTVTGLADALLDSTPIIVLTGQVATRLIGTDAFQEADTVGITRHCTKYNYLVKDATMLGRVIHEAFRVATTGRPGPVVIDIPKNVQMETGTYELPVAEIHPTYRPKPAIDPEKIATIVGKLAKAKRPIIYIGGGVVNSGSAAVAGVRELAALLNAPVTSTLMGLGAFPGNDPRFLGMLGMHGTYEANLSMNECDVMLAVGTRFDDRVTGRIDAFSPDSYKIHIDIDSSSINKIIPVDLAVPADAGEAVQEIVALWKKNKLKPATTEEWWERIARWRARKCLAYTQKGDIIEPQYAIDRLWAKVKDRNVIISTEVGQHQMWAAQRMDFKIPNRWVTSGGLGTMGFGLPAAIGAQVGNPDALVIDVAGEASILMNIQELGTAKQYRLPVKVFIMNNRYMGMIRQWQDLLYGGRYAESYSDSLPDFVALAEAYGMKGIRIERADQLDAGIDAMLTHDGPVVVDCAVAQKANCYPMIPSGSPHTEMLLEDPADDSDADARVENAKEHV